MAHEPAVTISVSGAYHAYQLADELQKRAMLGRVLTTYPTRYINRRFKLALDESRIRSNYLQLATEAIGRLHVPGSDPARVVRRLHDRWAERVYDRRFADVFVGWSSCALSTLRRAKREGSHTVIVRGSAHIAEQMDILAREYARYGRPFEVPRAAVEQELHEYEEADWVQTNSSFAKRTLVARGVPAEKILMVTTGVDLSRFRKVPKEDDTFRFVYCSALTIQKGIVHAVRAFASLDLPKAELYVIGPPHPETIDLLAPFASHPRIRWIGHVPQGELYRHFSQGSVFVMPSVQEGLATVQAQAMACGLPLLCTSHTGGEDFMSGEGREGYVVPASDEAALAERMRWFHDHPEECAAMGERARERVASGFTWDHYGARICEHYRAIVAGRQAA